MTGLFADPPSREAAEPGRQCEYRYPSGRRCGSEADFRVPERRGGRMRIVRYCRGHVEP